MKRFAGSGRLAGALLVGAVLATCQQAPLTGRQQLILLPESQDTQLGLEAYQQILDESRIAKNPELDRRVLKAETNIDPPADPHQCGSHS